MRIESREEKLAHESEQDWIEAQCSSHAGESNDSFEYVHSGDESDEPKEAEIHVPAILEKAPCVEMTVPPIASPEYLQVSSFIEQLANDASVAEVRSTSKTSEARFRYRLFKEPVPENVKHEVLLPAGVDPACVDEPVGNVGEGCLDKLFAGCFYTSNCP